MGKSQCWPSTLTLNFHFLSLLRCMVKKESGGAGPMLGLLDKKVVGEEIRGGERVKKN